MTFTLSLLLYVVPRSGLALVTGPGILVLGEPFHP